MKQYLDLVRHILKNGEEKQDRTGTGTISVFGYQCKYDLCEGFPLLTTKKVLFDALVYEDPGFVFTDVSDLGVSMAASQGTAYVKQFTVYPYYIDNLGALLG